MQRFQRGWSRRNTRRVEFGLGWKTLKIFHCWSGGIKELMELDPTSIAYWTGVNGKEGMWWRKGLIAMRCFGWWTWSTVIELVSLISSFVVIPIGHFIFKILVWGWGGALDSAHLSIKQYGFKPQFVHKFSKQIFNNTTLLSHASPPHVWFETSPWVLKPVFSIPYEWSHQNPDTKLIHGTIVTEESKA